MKTKVWIVAYRIGTELLRPDMCTTEKEAKNRAAYFISEAAYDAWDKYNDAEWPEQEELMKWAEDMGFVYNDLFFWDGLDEGYEASVFEYEL